MGSPLRLLAFLAPLVSVGHCWYYSSGGLPPAQAYASFHQSLIHHPSPLLSAPLEAVPLPPSLPAPLSSGPERYDENTAVANELGWGLPVGRTPLYVRLDNGLFVPVKAVYALPPFLERLVQRVQGYYSVYNPPETLGLNRPGPAGGSPPGPPLPGPIGQAPPGPPLPGQGPLGAALPAGGAPPPFPLTPQGAPIPPPPPPRPHDPDVSLSGPPAPAPESPPPPPTPEPEQPASTESDVEQVTETTTEP